MAEHTQFRRVVLRLNAGAADRTLIRTACEYARLLGLGLHGIFVEDAAVLGLTGLPFVREMQLATGEWRQLDSGRIANEFRAAATDARKLLDETAEALGLQRLFEVVRGDPAAIVVVAPQASDIIVVAQPALPAERMVQSIARLIEAAHGCIAAMMLVPSVLTRQRGAVAALVCGEAEASLQVAANIARAAGEELVLMVHGSSDLARQAVSEAVDTGMAPQRIHTLHLDAATADDMVRVLASGRERLIVLTRGRCGTADAAAPSLIAAARGVPVLIVEPTTELR